MSFKSLTRDELFKTAVEDFAVDVKKSDSKDVIIAALVEDGVTWEMYLEAHPESRPVEEPTPVWTEEPAVNEIQGETVTTAAPVVRTRPEPVTTQDLYLIKMERDNPYFEYKKYKFTSNHPFVVMPAEDADAILKEEEGFVIATPSEAREYYG